MSRVEWHCDRGLWGDAPAVEEQFDGKLEVLDCRVGVDEDDEAVRLEEFGEDVRLYPCVVVASGFHLFGIEEAVVVAVDLGYESGQCWVQGGWSV